MKLTPLDRFIEIGSDRSARGVLGVGAGTTTDAAVEAALARLIAKVRAHPYADSPDAARAIHQLEAYAREVELELSLMREPSLAPVHPLAKLRIERGAGTGQNAAGFTPTRPRAGVTEENLTEFDRVVLTILVSGGGWNPKTAAQLAAIAAEHGVSNEGLQRVVAGLAKFMRDGGAAALQKDMAAIGVSAERAHASRPQKPGAVEAVMDRIGGSITDDMQGRSPWSILRLAIFFGIGSVLCTLALVWMIVRGSGVDGNSATGGSMPLPTIAAIDDDSTKRERAAAALAQKFAPPDTNIEALANAAKYSRAPGFASSATPAVALQLSAKWPEYLTELDLLSRAISTNGGRLSGKHAADLATVMREAGISWAVSGAFRTEFIQATLQVAQYVKGEASARALVLAVHGLPESDALLEPVAPWHRVWRNALAAGLLAEIVRDAKIEADVASAAREALRRDGVSIPASVTTQRFNYAAIASLSNSAHALADATTTGLATVTLDDWSRWLEAVDAASENAKLREGARLIAIEAILLNVAPIDLQNDASDALGRLITDIDWSNRGVSGDQARTAFGSWFANPAIAATRLWVLTSMLDRNHRIAWFSPEMVLPVDANALRRDAALRRILDAWPKAESGEQGENLALASSTLDLIRTSIATLFAQLETTHDDVESLAIAESALEVVHAVRLFDAGKAADAGRALSASGEALKLDRRALEAPFAGESGLRPSGSSDGAWSDEFTRPGLNADERQKRIASLRAMPATGDLGPRDAEVLAREAFAGNASDTRRAAQGAIADKFASGKTVLLAVLDALAEQKPREEAAAFLAALLNREFTGRDWIPVARAALVERILSLESSADAAVDRMSMRVMGSANAITVLYAPSILLMDIPVTLDGSIAALGGAVRVAADDRFLTEPFPAAPAELERLRIARRGLAEGSLQRAVADAASLVEQAAAIEAARRPSATPALREILANTALARSNAQSASAQLAATMIGFARVVTVNIEAEVTHREDEP